MTVKQPLSPRSSVRAYVTLGLCVLVGACSPVPQASSRRTSAGRGYSRFIPSNPRTSRDRLSEVQSGQGRFAYTHDELGRETRTSVVQSLGGAYSFEYRYGYSSGRAGGATGAGNVLVERTVPGGDTVRYAYDSAARRSSIHYGSRPILVSEKRDAAGRVVERVLGDGSKTVVDYHENTKQPRRMFTSKNGATIVNLAYEYDARMNPLRIDDAAAGSTTYEYDSRNQLVAARGTRGNHAYRYDSIGNLVGLDGDAMTYGGSRPHAPTAFRGATFAYDANGNRVEDLRGAARGRDQRIAWTQDNRVSAVMRGEEKVLERAYVGDRLWLKIEYGQDGSRHTVEYLPSLRVENARLREQFDGLAERLPNGDYRFFHVDHLGSLRATTDGEGSVVAQFAYGPYGEIETLRGTFDRTRGFNGREHDSSGYVNFGDRDYDPFTKRWLSPDVANDDGLNRYAFVRNNPIRYFDANGRQSASCGAFCQFNEGRADAQWDTKGMSGHVYRSWYDQRATQTTWQDPSGSPAWKWGYATQQTAAFVSEFGSRMLGAVGAALSGAATTRPIQMPPTLNSSGSNVSAPPVPGKNPPRNPVPATLARVMPGDVTRQTIGKPGDRDVFVAAAREIQGLSVAEIAARLTIPLPEGGTFTVYMFPAPRTGIATPVARDNPGFVQGGLTAGGAREFVIPNGPFPRGTVRFVIRNDQSPGPTP